MAKQVCNLAMLKCSMGVAPGTFMVTPEKMENTSNQPAANIMDHIPMKNILPFGMCTSPSNPAVAAAMGAPVPCVPVTTSPWVPGAPTVLIKNSPALNDTSKLICMMGGVIEVTNPGQQTHDIP
jgi:uncharacterized protein DUF4280